MNQKPIRFRNVNNELDGKVLNTRGFAYLNLLDQDVWTTFTPVFGSLTVVGTPTYTGRMKALGRQLFFQVTLMSSTSIASAAGTDYLTLPILAKGLAGMATMTNDTTNVSVGTCHIDVTNSRCYLPAQAASANTFTIAGWYEVGI